MGPAGPGSVVNGPASSGGLRVVDSHGTTVGDWQSPGYVSMTVNSETVFIALDLAARTFLAGSPAYYYTDANCTSQPMMFLDMTHFGTVSSGVVYYPTGGVISTTYGSFNSGGGCQHFGSSGTFGAVATTSVASLVAPFALAH
jgi:hypothetical protein